MKKTYSKNVLYSIIGFLLLFALWFIIAQLIGEKKLIFPGPFETIKDFFRLLTIKSTYISIYTSLYKMLVGYLFSILLALIFGIIAGLYDFLYQIFKPIITTLKAIPTATLLFLFLVLAGFDNSPIYVVILVSFPILYESVSGGIRNIPKSINDAILLDGGNKVGNILKIRVPLAFNYILIGIASSFGLAFKVEIMSEILTGSTGKGIGCSIKVIQATQTDMTGIFSWSLIAIVILLLVTFISNLIKKSLKISK